MFATLLQHYVGGVRRRRTVAALSALDDHLLEDVGFKRDSGGMGFVDVSDVAASSSFPLHDAWSNRSIIRAVASQSA